MQYYQLLGLNVTAVLIFFAIYTDLIALSSWQTHLFAPGNMSEAYKAPLLGCDQPGVLEHDYIVFLHPGHSLSVHKQNVSNVVDLSSAIDYVFEETKSHGLYYHAILSDTALAAVRADRGVDMVECNRSVPMPDDGNL
jgi:hypothetical protein